MPLPGKSFASGKHSITLKLTAAEMAALKKAVLLLTIPGSAQDAKDIVSDRCYLRRFIRKATHQVALAAIRAGEIPNQFACNVRDESEDEYQERIYLMTNPEKIHQPHFGWPEAVIEKINFWKSFRGGRWN